VKLSVSNKSVTLIASTVEDLV